MFTSARRAFWSLILLSSLTFAGLAGLLAWQAPRLAAGVWLACQGALQLVVGSLPTVGLILPLLLLLASLLAALGSLFRQGWHTQRLVADLAQRRRPLPPRLARVAQELDLAGRLELVEDDGVYTFAQGLWRPRVWISNGLTNLLDDAELRAVLRHERHHLNQRDPLRIVLSRCLAQALFFLPLAPTLRDRYLVAKEIEADVASAADDGLAVAAALLKMLRSGASLPAGQHDSRLAAIGPLDITRERVDRLLHPEQKAHYVVSRRQSALSLLLGVALVVTTYVSMAQASSPPQGGECGYSTYLPEWQSVPADYTPLR